MVREWEHDTLPALAKDDPQLAAFQDLTPPTVEVIGDFQHVSPMALRALLGARGVNDICCITDAIAESINTLERKETLIMPWKSIKSNLICCVTYLQRSTNTEQPHSTFSNRSQLPRWSRLLI